MRTGAIAVIVLFLIAASIVALAAMIHGAGKFEWNGFYPWVIGPLGARIVTLRDM
jgi:hypothetical protein